MTDEKELWKALSDENRRNIIELLLEKDFCVRGLSRRIGISEAAISQHIKVLKKGGLISGEKRGYYVHYHVERDVLRKLGNQLLEWSDRTREIECPHGCSGGRNGFCRMNTCEGHRCKSKEV